MKERTERNRELEFTIHSNYSSVGISAVKDYIDLRRSQVMEGMLNAMSMEEVADAQGRVRELETLHRIICNGPHEIEG